MNVQHSPDSRTCFTRPESAITPWKLLKTFVARKVKTHSRCKNIDDQARSSRPKIVDFEAVLQAIEANPASSVCRVSGELVIETVCDSSPSRLQRKHPELPNCTSHTSKILQNFWLIRVIAIINENALSHDFNQRSHDRRLF